MIPYYNLEREETQWKRKTWEQKRTPNWPKEIFLKCKSVGKKTAKTSSRKRKSENDLGFSIPDTLERRRPPGFWWNSQNPPNSDSCKYSTCYSFLILYFNLRRKKKLFCLERCSPNVTAVRFCVILNIDV